MKRAIRLDLDSPELGQLLHNRHVEKGLYDCRSGEESSQQQFEESSRKYTNGAQKKGYSYQAKRLMLILVPQIDK